MVLMYWVKKHTVSGCRFLINEGSYVRVFTVLNQISENIITYMLREQ